tara:strand:+ start:191 stop:802 length:612 start_codon:yes stop_codon:yes gene_type:complete
MIDPLTAALVFNLGKTAINFGLTRTQNKQRLQQLNQQRLLAELEGIQTSNRINEIATETLADNYTVASTSGYSPLESASFKAIQKKVESRRDKDITNAKLSTTMAINSINTSLQNLNTSMQMNELGLIMDTGSLWFSHSNHIKNKELEKAYRAKQIKLMEEHTRAMKGMVVNQRGRNWGSKQLLRRAQGKTSIYGNYYGKYRD